MFEVGKHYYITHGIGDDVGSSGFTILEIDMPLIKAEGPPGMTTIFNTSSATFHKAVPLDRDPRDPVSININFGDEARG
jgi:hypothetical protein